MIDEKRKSKILCAFDRSERLNISNPRYKSYVDGYFKAEIRNDLSHGDVTTKLLFPKKFDITADIISKKHGILCGMHEIEYFLKEYCGDRVLIKKSKKDGSSLRENDIVMQLFGNVDYILGIERIVLNFLMRMSGIATLTRKMAGLAGNNVMISPTRKTLWGPMDKRACKIGGALTHRLSLSDAIIIKDNHLALLKDGVSEVLPKILEAKQKANFVEIEVENEHEAVPVIKYIEKHFAIHDVPVCIMFDNMKSSSISKILKKTKKTDIILEASGEINAVNIKDYAKTGVDVISMGFLTNDASPLDFSMEVKK